VRSISPPPPIIDLANLDACELPAFNSTKNTVYIGGSWDSFSAGHVEYLRRAKEASYSLSGTGSSVLVVGIWSDEVVQEMTGERPLLMLLERALAVVQCRYTDALVLNATAIIPASFCDLLGIDTVINEYIAVSEERTRSHYRNIEVVRPKFQTLASLREKVFGEKEAFEKRQQRKGGIA